MMAEIRDVLFDHKSDLSHIFDHSDMFNVRKDVSDSWDMLDQANVKHCSFSSPKRGLLIRGILLKG